MKYWALRPFGRSYLTSRLILNEFEIINKTNLECLKFLKPTALEFLEQKEKEHEAYTITEINENTNQTPKSTTSDHFFKDFYENDNIQNSSTLIEIVKFKKSAALSKENDEYYDIVLKTILCHLSRFKLLFVFIRNQNIVPIVSKC